MATSRINGVELYWESTGSGGEPLVLVHGSWVDHHSWDQVVSELARSFTVLTYDRRGHSLSERVAGQGSIRQDVDDLLALVQQLGLVPAHIAGNSFGAAIALRAAAHEPAAFRSLIAHEPPVFGLLGDDPQEQAALQEIGARVQAVADLLANGSTEAGTRLFVDGIAFGPGAWEQLPEPLRRTFISNALTFLDELQEPESMTLDLDTLAGYAGPALLTRGAASPPFFTALIAKVARALPQARQHSYPDAGHVPHLTHPRAYVAGVTQFIRDLPAVKLAAG